MLTYLLRLFKTLSKIERSIIYGCATIALGAGLIITWNVFTEYTTLKPAAGGEYTEGVVGQPTSINPLMIAAGGADKDLITLLFADLMTLTERYEVSSTGKVWLITLKDDLVWSDGKALTADDVVFTIRTIQYPDAGSALFDGWQGVSVERVSELQIRFTLKAPYGYFTEALKQLRIAPAHIFEDIPVSNIRLSNYNLEPVTSGPYAFESYEKRRDGFITKYHLAINNEYAGSRAFIEHLTVAFFPTYQDALIAFNRKQIDGLGGLAPEQVETLRISHTLHQSTLPQYYALFFNPATNPVFKNKTVRQALTRATDRDTIAAVVFNSYADAAVGPFGPVSIAYASSVYMESYFSLEKAQELLSAQGWKSGADGVLTRGSGKTLERLAITITTPDLPFLETTAQLIKTQWERLGVRVSINSVPSDRIESEVIAIRNYEVLLFGNMLGVGSDLYSFWHSSQRYNPGLNFALYQNTKADKLIETIRTTTDPALRIDPLIQLLTYLRDDAPAVFLYSPRYLYASPTSLGGVTESPLDSIENRLSTVNEWHLRTERVFSATSTQ